MMAGCGHRAISADMSAHLVVGIATRTAPEQSICRAYVLSGAGQGIALELSDAARTGSID